MNDKINVLIQARCNSDRFPFKVIYPIKNIPLIVLLAKRVSSKYTKVFVLTSNEPTDDELCKILKKNKIKYYRGHLYDVNKRYKSFIKKNKLQSNYFVRLTADNPFVDYRLVKKIYKETIKRKSNYSSINYKKSNVPYGISVEVINKKLFLKCKANLNYEKEHVTISIKKIINHNFESNLVFFKRSLKMYSYNSSIDRFEDFLIVKEVFKKFNNPIKVSWKVLCRKLLKIKKKIIINKNYKELKNFTIGCAQLGEKYGINNLGRIYNKENAKKFLDVLVNLGFQSLDTASSYKNSEKYIGDFLYKKKNIKIFTKIGEYKKNLKKSDDKIFLKKTLINITSCLKRLKRNSVEGVMFHSIKNVIRDPSFFKQLEVLNKKNKMYKSIGISIYDEEDLNIFNTYSKFKIIQLPFNILNMQLYNKAIKLKTKPNIFIRSIFLQGLFFSKKKPLNISAGEMQKIKKITNFQFKKFNRINVYDFLLAFARYVVNNSTKLIVGIDNLEQLYYLRCLLEYKKLKKKEFFQVCNIYKKIKFNKVITDPRKWIL